MIKISSVYVKKREKANISHIPKHEVWCPQRQTLRDRRPITTGCPACWALGTKEWKKCTSRKKIFCTGPTRAAKAEQKSPVRARKPNKPTKKDPFICPLLSPHSPKFQPERGERGKLSAQVELSRYFFCWGGGDATRVEGLDKVKGSGPAPPHPRQAGLNLPSCCNVRQKVANASLHLYSLVCGFNKSAGATPL